MQLSCQTIAKSKINYYLAHEENARCKLSTLCTIIKIQTFFEKNNRMSNNYEKSFWPSPLFWSFPWLLLWSVCLSCGLACIWAWGLRRGDGCGWDNGVVSMEDDWAIALFLGRCLGRRILIPLLRLLGFPGALICCLEAT